MRGTSHTNGAALIDLDEGTPSTMDEQHGADEGEDFSQGGDNSDDDDDDINDSDDFQNNKGNFKKHDKQKLKLAQKEARLVAGSRIIMGFVLLASAALVGYATYKFVNDEEMDDFETTFRSDAHELLRGSAHNYRNIHGLVRVFAELLSSSAAATVAVANASAGTNSTSASNGFPFYTMPDFEVFGSRARELSGALMLAYTPLVMESQRAAWEEYSAANAATWIQDGLQFLDQSEAVSNLRPVSPYIYKKTLRSHIPEDEGLDVYAPVWQISPAPTDTSVVNFNVFNHPVRGS